MAEIIAETMTYRDQTGRVRGAAVIVDDVTLQILDARENISTAGGRGMTLVIARSSVDRVNLTPESDGRVTDLRSRNWFATQRGTGRNAEISTGLQLGMVFG